MTTPTSIVEAIKTYLAAYTELVTNAPLSIDFLGTALPGYSIVSLPGGGWIEKYIGGGGIKEYTFAFQSEFSTADEAERLDNCGFYEAFSEWLDAQTEANNLPILPAGKTSEKIEATSQGFLYEQGESQTGTYQIICRLEYKKES